MTISFGPVYIFLPFLRHRIIDKCSLDTTRFSKALTVIVSLILGHLASLVPDRQM